MIATPLVLDELRKDSARVLFTTPGASLIDLDDGVLCLEFHSKGNTLDGDTIDVAEHAFALIPGRYLGLVVGNQGKHFSYGANLQWLLSLLERIGDDRATFRTHAKRFQRVTTGVRTAPFPVVAAPFNRTIGGALELCLYADRICAHTDLSARLPEVAVGILPDLGGTSELYRRCIVAAGPGREATGLQRAFETIVFMKEGRGIGGARDLGFLSERDGVTTDLAHLIDDAKAQVRELAPGYLAPPHHREIVVLGDDGYAALDRAIGMAVFARMATPYDAQIARAVARIMTGGPGPARTLSHEELLDLETAYFETLIFEPKTRERMEHMLATGEPLRN
ncbi:MAG: enoyl-CoA hydratase/isomerase family protein [Vulcanimicrobiaceae bacterium]